MSALSDRPHTPAEVDAALQALREPGRLAQAQELVARSAPDLQRVLAEALGEGGWFDAAHQAEVQRACAALEGEKRVRAVGALVAEQTRLGMFVGVTIGFELAEELRRQGR